MSSLGKMLARLTSFGEAFAVGSASLIILVGVVVAFVLFVIKERVDEIIFRRRT